MENNTQKYYFVDHDYTKALLSPSSLASRLAQLLSGFFKHSDT